MTHSNSVDRPASRIASRWLEATIWAPPKDFEGEALPAIAALEELQRGLRLDRTSAEAWVRQVADERAASELPSTVNSQKH